MEKKGINVLLLKTMSQKARKRGHKESGLDEAIAKLQLQLTVNRLNTPKAKEPYTTQAEAIITLTKNVQKMLKKANKRDHTRRLLDSYDRNYKWIMGATIVGSMGVIATGLVLPILAPTLVTMNVKSALTGLAIGTGPFLATMIARFSYFLSGKKEFQPKRTAEEYALKTYTEVEIGKDLNKLDEIATGNSQLIKGNLSSRQIKKLEKLVTSIRKNITKMSERDQRIEDIKTHKPDRRPDILYQDEMALTIAKQKFRESNLGLTALHYFVLGPKFGNRFIAGDLPNHPKTANEHKVNFETCVGLTPRHQDMLKMMEEKKGQTFPELYDWFRGSLKESLNQFAKNKVTIQERAV